MYKSTPNQMKDFYEGNIWNDMENELKAWIYELQEILSDPDGPKDIETISTLRGSIKACKNFLQMPRVLEENIREDMRHDERAKQEKKKKSWR